jgi:prepilin-type N-terminal cleavage/methylation domain-containing protein
MVVRLSVPLTYRFLLLKCINLSKLGELSANWRSTASGCRSKMILNAKFLSPRRSRRNGFSLVELVLSLAVLLVITTLAVPVVVRSLQTYQLNSTASQLAGMLKFAKFDAIRQNTPVNFQVAQSGASWIVWVDSNGDGVPNGTEPQMVISGNNTLLPASSVPSPSPILATLGAGSSAYTWAVLSGAPGSIMYDQRGVIISVAGGPVVTTISALYLGNPNDSSSGYRAIITLPSGAVQVWTSSSAGNWQRVS